MNRRRISYIIIIFTVMFAFAGVYGVYLDVHDDKSVNEDEPFYFELVHSGIRDTLIPWKNPDGDYDLFLPSYGRLSDLILRVNGTKWLIFDGRPIKSGKSFPDKEFDEPYTLRIGDADYTLTFHSSKNVAALFVTVKDEDYYITKNKDRKEKATANFISEDGEESTGELSATIKGHGNSTWLADKKPYQIKLDKSRSILGMGDAKKWLLIANAYDATNMRNKIIYDLSNELFSEWSVKGEYADVYLNGRYNGLYLITEKIEKGDNRISKEADFVVEQETAKRDDEADYMTTKDIAIQVVEPENYDDDTLIEISDTIQQMEDSFFYPGSEWKTIIDMDSWAKKYLIDEFSGNFDADKLSSYMYAMEDSGRLKIYGGPVWDYDKAFMQEDSVDEPYLFAAAATYRRRNVVTPYYKALFEKPAFRKHVAKVYKKELRPLLEALVKDGYDELSDRLYSANVNNFYRCQPFIPPVGYTHKDLKSAIAAVKRYINARIHVMDDKWINGSTYHIVGIEPEERGKIREYEVKDGNMFDKFPDAGYYDIAEPVWYDNETGEEYDQPFVPRGDIYLYLKKQPKEAQ